MIEEKKVVGYVRSLRELGDDCDIQTMLINRYAQIIGLDNPVMYVDKGFVPKRSLKDIERSQRLGITHLYARYYQAWEEMLLEAINDRIGIIIVDRMERLYGNTEDKIVLEKIAQEHAIRILEVENLDWPEESHISKVWAYHYYAPKRYADRRTAALLNEIGTFYETVASQPGWRFCGLYMDSRIDRRTEFTKLWRRKDIDVVVCKSLYHISRKPLVFLNLVNEMNARGITLLSTEEGVVHYNPSGDSFLKKNCWLCHITAADPNTRKNTILSIAESWTYFIGPSPIDGKRLPGMKKTVPDLETNLKK